MPGHGRHAEHTTRWSSFHSDVSTQLLSVLLIRLRCGVCCEYESVHVLRHRSGTRQPRVPEAQGGAVAGHAHFGCALTVQKSRNHSNKDSLLCQEVTSAIRCRLCGVQWSASFRTSVNAARSRWCAQETVEHAHPHVRLQPPTAVGTCFVSQGPGLRCPVWTNEGASARLPAEYPHAHSSSDRRSARR
jgi:hypothetical protein